MKTRRDERRRRRRRRMRMKGQTWLI